MAQRDYVSRGRSPQKKKPAGKGENRPEALNQMRNLTPRFLENFLLCALLAYSHW